MSQKKIFRCQDCGYETEVYEGRGFMGQHIEAMSCPDCRKLASYIQESPIHINGYQTLALQMLCFPWVVGWVRSQGWQPEISVRI